MSARLEMHSKFLGKILGIISHKKYLQGLPDWKCIQNFLEKSQALFHTKKHPQGLPDWKCIQNLGKKSLASFYTKKHPQGLPDLKCILNLGKKSLVFKKIQKVCQIGNAFKIWENIFGVISHQRVPTGSARLEMHLKFGEKSLAPFYTKNFHRVCRIRNKFNFLGENLCHYLAP